MHGSLKSVCGDTLGAHYMFGLMSPSANTFCRLCLTKRNKILEHSSEKTVKLRNRASHDYIVATLENNSDAQQVGIDGVRTSCILNHSNYFHITSNRIMDAMHDVLEGVAPFIVMLTLRAFSSLEPHYGINASLINERLDIFDSGPDDTISRPLSVFDDSKIKKPKNNSTQLNASQNWCLVRYLPLLIGEKVDKGDCHWELLLTLLSTMEIIFSPAISLEAALWLQVLIKQLLYLLKSLYAEINPINKFHHLIHYVNNIISNGLPIGNWCERYESFHNEFKRLSKSNCNFINIPKTVAAHLQLTWCKNLTKSTTFDDCVTFSKTFNTLSDDFRFSLQSFLGDNLYDSPNFVNWINVNGFLFKRKSALVKQKSHESSDELPQFCQVELLFMDR